MITIATVTDIVTYVIPYINTILAIMLGIGMFVSLRGGYSKQAGEIQEKVIAALKEQIEALERHVESDKEEITKLKLVFEALQYTLRQRGIEMVMNGETITLTDTQKRVTHVTPIRKTSLRKPKDIDPGPVI